MAKAWTVLVCMLVAACDSEVVSNAQRVELRPSGVPGRFRVELVQIVNDSVAYGGRRGVYVITDAQTGKEYVGVSGIGISELGSHAVPAGKSTIIVPDER